MMSLMISYTTSLLNAIASFLASEPIIYLFGVVVATFVVDILLNLMGRRS